jgi:hypothetical protein
MVSVEGILAAPKEIADLVERFCGNLSKYKPSNYKRAQCRQEFKNQFFKALGWDMDDKQRNYACALSDLELFHHTEQRRIHAANL